MEAKRTKTYELDRLAVELSGSHVTDKNAISDFFKAAYPFIKSVSKRIVSSHPSRQRVNDLEDLTQIACWKIRTSLSSFDCERGKLTKWIWTVVRGAWLDVLSPREESLLASTASVLVEECPDATGLVEDRLMARGAIFALERTLSTKTFDLIMRNASGHSANDIASVDKENVETVKSRIRVARTHAIAAFVPAA